MTELQEALFWARIDLEKAIESLRDVVHINEGIAMREKLITIQAALTRHLEELNGIEPAELNLG